MSRNRISISDKWSWGGDGNLSDLVVFPPAIKVFVLEPLKLATQKLGQPTRIAFIYFLAYQAIQQTQPHISASQHYAEAAAWTFLGLIYLSLLSAAKIKTRNHRIARKNIRNFSATKRPVVPLDKSNSFESCITLDRSIMIGGESGSGKSNVIWVILKGIRKYQIPSEFYIIDPAGGVELAELEHAPETKEYVDRPRDAEPMIQKVHAEMEIRLRYMKEAGIKELTPSKEHPLRLLIIDDLLLIGTAKQDATTPLGEILAVGRKAATIVLGATQLNQVDAIGRIRDLFPQRVAMRAPTSWASQAILGKPTPDSSTLFTVGHGYVHIDGQRDIQRIASPYISTREKREIAVPQRNIAVPKSDNPIRERRTAVYRLYSSQDVLLYVGISDNPSRRNAEESRDPDKASWWPSVDPTRTVIQWYENRELAESEETRAINEEHPIYNVAKVQL